MNLGVSVRRPLSFTAAFWTPSSAPPAPRTRSFLFALRFGCRRRGRVRRRGNRRRLVMMRPVHMHHRASAIGDLALGGALDHELRDMHVLIGRDRDGNAVAQLDVVQMRAFLIEDIERDIDRGGGDERHHAVSDQPVLDGTQNVERDRTRSSAPCRCPGTRDKAWSSLRACRS